MIDARVDDAVKQHLQKMDWLHAEEEVQTLTPPTAGATAGPGKMGFTLPVSEAPQAEEVIAPVLEVKAEQESESIPPPSEATPAGQDCVVKAEAAATVESLAEPAASTDGEGKVEKEDKSASSPPKDGTPV